MSPERRFYFDLALRLKKPVWWILENMGSSELAEWAQYFKILAIEAEQNA